MYSGINPNNLSVSVIGHSLDISNPLPVYDTDKQTTQETFRITTPPITPSENLIINKPCFLKQFICDFRTGGNFTNSIDFIDSAEVPLTGSEKNVFGFLISQDLTQHNFQFPDNGLYFSKGLVIKCSNISGTPNITAVNATGIYTS